MKKTKTAAVAFVATFGLAFLLAGCSGNSTGGEDSSSGGSLGVYWNTSVSYGTLKDSRDGKSYRTVNMPDGEVWMAENLNYAASGSWCYEGSTSNCATYGRLYDWSTAMGISSSYNSSLYSGSDENRQGVCPIGWHLPSDAEWDALEDAISGSVGTKLKSKSGWNNKEDGSSGNGTDDYGFSALPGGGRDNDGSFLNVGYDGYWWSSTEGSASIAYGRGLSCSYADLSASSGVSKEFGLSVRCLRD